MAPDPLPFRLPTPRDIERLAFEANVTVEAVCKRAGVSTQTFRNWKYDRGSPSLDTVRRLLAAGTELLAVAEGGAVAPTSSRRKSAGKSATAKDGVRAKPAAAKRQARRRA
jgi:hypothetical protein